jgi:hypothetical protein
MESEETKLFDLNSSKHFPNLICYSFKIFTVISKFLDFGTVLKDLLS